MGTPFPKKISLNNISQFSNRFLKFENKSNGLLIITPKKFQKYLDIFVTWKKFGGIYCFICTLEYINCSFQGQDLAEKIKLCIIEYFKNSSIGYVLLFGDTNIIPIRYVYNPDTMIYGTFEKIGDNILKPTDYYYSDLSSLWDEDKDNIFGESEIYNKNKKDEIDWIPDVAVGRIPVETESEAKNIIEKLLKYQFPNYFLKNYSNNWLNKFLMIGTVSNYEQDPGYDYDTDEAEVSEFIINDY
ncbi:MAG: C25 family cysteine peptidase, partial [Promethearchaeota archaeon]